MGNWIAVASADHVAIGRRDGFIQVNHGKSAPLRRMRPGDLLACYSPVQVYRSRLTLRAFTAIGRVRPGDIYQGEMGGGFVPFRRDMDWFDGDPAPIAPLLDRLDLTAGKRNWGLAFRSGLLAIGAGDMALIAAAMGADPGRT